MATAGNELNHCMKSKLEYSYSKQNAHTLKQNEREREKKRTTQSKLKVHYFNQTNQGFFSSFAHFFSPCIRGTSLSYDLPYDFVPFDNVRKHFNTKTVLCGFQCEWRWNNWFHWGIPCVMVSFSFSYRALIWAIRFEIKTLCIPHSDSLWSWNSTKKKRTNGKQVWGSLEWWRNLNFISLMNFW